MEAAGGVVFGGPPCSWIVSTLAAARKARTGPGSLTLTACTGELILGLALPVRRTASIRGCAMEADDLCRLPVSRGFRAPPVAGVPGIVAPTE
eukprot:14690679-Alexandrium_andersonii.AAC.1